MKSVIGILFISLVTSISQAQVLPFIRVTNSIYETATIVSAKTRIVSRNTNFQRPYRSWIRFELFGTYESGICSDKELILQTQPLGAQEMLTSENFRYSLDLLKTKRAERGYLDLTPRVCAAVIEEGHYSLPIYLQVPSWAPGQRSVQWEYELRKPHTDQVGSLLRVKFDLNSGWTIRVDPVF